MFIQLIVGAERGLALKLREKLRSQKCRIILVKKTAPPLSACRAVEHALNLATLRARPDGQVLHQPGHKYLVRHFVVLRTYRRMSKDYGHAVQTPETLIDLIPIRLMINRLTES
jgi:hypothetical protein